ncbi:uncharacterized protein LOC144506149 [Mustelus asterias]
MEEWCVTHFVGFAHVFPTHVRLPQSENRRSRDRTGNQREERSRSWSGSDQTVDRCVHKIIAFLLCQFSKLAELKDGIHSFLAFYILKGQKSNMMGVKAGN